MACLFCSSLTFQRTLSSETGSVSRHGNPCSSLQLVLSLKFLIQPAPPDPHSLKPCCGSSQPALTCLHGPPPCYMSPLLACPYPIGLGECFFNPLVVRVPCSLISWHFWLFIVFISVVILLSVVRRSEVFLPIPPSWPELR